MDYKEIEFNIDFLHKTEKSRVILFLLSSIIFYFIGYSSLVLDVDNKIIKAKDSVVSLEKELVLAKKQSEKTFEEYKLGKENAKEVFLKIDKLFPRLSSKQITAKFVSKVQEYNLKLLRLKPSGEKKEGILNYIKLSILLEGKYYNIQQLLEYLARHENIIVPKNFRINTKQDTLSLNLQLIIYTSLAFDKNLTEDEFNKVKNEL